MSGRGQLLTALAFVLVAVGSYWLGSRLASPARVAAPGESSRKILYYACPMHPQYRSERPGDAPCCGMRLEPVYADSSGSGPVTPDSIPAGTVHVSPERQQLAGLTTAAVYRMPGAHTLRTAGRVAPDERRVYNVNAAINGWVRETFANTTGSLVEKDERLATIYSPDYRNAQQAYLTALARLEYSRESLKDAPEQLAAVENSVLLYRDSLRNLGMGDPQIEEMGRAKAQTENIHVISPATGFVIARNVSSGQRFVSGQELFRIADLSRVWVLADLFERESQYIRSGQEARVLHQGRVLMATVSQILPQFDANSRTLKVRLEVDNPGYPLRPDMFVDVEFPLRLPPAIAVPVDAVLDSGLRKTVFVAHGGGNFEPRIVETGWRFGDRVEITKGLKTGEQIVVSGNFLLDSESRMRMAAAPQPPPGSPSPAPRDKDLAAMETGTAKAIKDVVCGMDVDPAKAAGKSIYRGTTYYFCSDHCKKEFDAHPGEYVAGTAPETHTND